MNDRQLAIRAVRATAVVVIIAIFLLAPIVDGNADRPTIAPEAGPSGPH